MSSMLFSSQPTTPSPLSRALPVEGDVLEHVRVRAVKHGLPPRTTRTRSSSQSSTSSSSSSGANSPITPSSPDRRLAYGDLMRAFMPSSSTYHPRPPFSRRGSMASNSSEDDLTITPIRLAHASEPSRDIAQAFDTPSKIMPRRSSNASLPFPRLTPPGSPSPYLSEGRRGSVRSLTSHISRESLRRQPAVVSLPTEDLYYTPPESPFSAARRMQLPPELVEEEDITACYSELGFKGFGV